MIRAANLLTLSRTMLTLDATKPKQETLRRAISTAYYALFNLLLDGGCRQVATAPSLRDLVRRGFGHGEMKKVARVFQGGTLPKHVAQVFEAAKRTPDVPAELRRVAKAFVGLQEARHEADYDPTRPTPNTRKEADDWIALAEAAFADWETVRGRPLDALAVEVFLTGLLLWDRWGKG